MRLPLFVALGLCLASLTAAPLARAGDGSTDGFPKDTTSVRVETTGAGVGPDHALHGRASASKRLSLELNPLGLALGHYSAQLEIGVAPHSVLTISPYVDYVRGEFFGLSSELTGVTGVGTEVGYRYYTDRDRPAGFFFGPSLIGGGFHQTNDSGQVTRSFALGGVAMDLGGQVIVGPGIVIGAGLGVQYNVSGLSYDENPALMAEIIAGRGLRPRALLSFGYAI